MDTISTQLAPICLFVYNRPEHTRKTLEYLSNARLASESNLYIFADGPKANASSEALKRISDVRCIIREKKWCKNVFIKESDANQGLANSVIAGVTAIVNQYGTAIIIEDDLLVSKSFLEFMNQALERYALDEKVMQISAHFFPVEINSKEAFFLSFISSWGWAVWKRSWEKFDPDCKRFNLLSQSWIKKYRFNLNNSFDYYEMLLSQLDGRINSWAIRWNLTVFLNEGLVLYPSKSMVQNIGFDNSGTHCDYTTVFDTDMIDMVYEDLPHRIIIDRESFLKVTDYFKSQNMYRAKDWKDKLFPFFDFKNLSPFFRGK